MVARPLFFRSNSRPVALLLGLLLVFYLINGIFYIRAQSVTADEGGFLNYAIRLLKGHPERIYPARDNSKMPVSVMNLIPRAIAQLMHPGMKKNDAGASDVFAGRYVTLVCSVFTLLLVFKWCGELYGEHAALFAVFLTTFSPDIIANSGLVTTDSYSALFLLATVYFLWRFCNLPSYRHLILFSVCIAFSQLVKQSLFHLYIISPILIGVFFSFNRMPLRAKNVIFYFLLFLLINWVVINLGFYFKGTNTAIGGYHFMSSTFREFQRLIPLWLPLPFPKAFITGLDMAKYYDQIGGGTAGVSSFGNVTILGHSATGGGFWYYYLVSIFFKTPVSSLVFIISSIVLIVKVRPSQFIKNEFFLLAPVLYFLLYMSFLYNTQCGIRQMIFIYPFLFILCGSMFRFLNNPSFKIIAGLLSVYLVISVLQYWRNYYPYTNEFVADKKMAYRYVGASNLEFLQGYYFFGKYLQAHPGVRYPTGGASAGTFLINTNDYLDVWNLHHYDWLRSGKLVGQVAYNGLLVTVAQKDLQHLPLNLDKHD